MKQLIHLIHKYTHSESDTHIIDLQKEINGKLEALYEKPKWSIDSMAQSSVITNERIIITTTVILHITEPRPAQQIKARLV